MQRELPKLMADASNWSSLISYLTSNGGVIIETIQYEGLIHVNTRGSV